MKAGLLVIAGLVLIVALANLGPTFETGTDELERHCIDDGYENAIRGLYRHLFDTLITNPPLDDEQAEANFKKGLKTARRARLIALQSLE